MFSPVSGFPNYIINDNGVIYSQRGEMKQQIRNGYHRVGLINEKRYFFSVHRLVYQHFGKDWNPELTVDHIDGNPLNNHISNLRMATSQQQMYNMIRKNKYGKGIRITKTNRYVAQIQINGKNTHLGTFETIEEAKEVHDTKAKELHGEFYRG